MNNQLYPGVFIHESAYVDSGAIIGEGTRIWHFTHVMSKAVIGADCNIGQNVFIAEGAIIGRNVKIQNNVSVYKGVVCEDDVFLGPSMIFTNVLNPRSEINRQSEYKQTTVRKGATIGAGAIILCGIDIGRYAFVGAGAVVTHSLPDYALVTGNPARQTGWMSEAGEKLQFNQEGRAVCSVSGDEFRLDENMQTVEKMG